jgi:hypothetical protein
MIETMPALSHIDERMTQQYVDEQIGFLEQYMGPSAPVLPHEVGHSAVATSVEVNMSSVEARTRPSEAQAAAMAAEAWNSYSPFKPENTAMFGSEEARLQAVETVRGIAGQAQMTGKYLNGRHKALGRELTAGKITQDEHDQAVGEIAAVFALTNPAHLRNVGEAQRASIARRQKAGQLDPSVKFVDLTSRVTEEGQVELAGIDSVMASITGARSQAELVARGLEFKKEAYGAEALAKATTRQEAQQAELYAKAVAFHHEQQVRRQMELIDEEAKLLFEREKKKEESNA